MNLALPAIAAFLLLGTGSCQNSAVSAHKTSATAKRKLNAGSMAASLRAAGFDVQVANTISQPFFSAPGRVLVVVGDDLQVYEYVSAEAATADAAKISPSGSPIGTSMPSWMRPPHFFHSGNLIVVYLGDDSRVRSELATQLGPQIAGAK